jgi:NAD+ synthase
MMKLAERISEWIKNYASTNGLETLVVGISGGIDSSVVSTLCALSGLKTVVVNLPLHQNQVLNDRALKHGHWLTQHYKNVEFKNIDLTPTYDTFMMSLDKKDKDSNLADANTKSRLRMVALYQIAGSSKGLVVGTGNKIEDFGVGFFTKYGDGGVDISPIADLMKSEVWQLGKDLGVSQEIIDAKPTDGLWQDDRTDEDQLGMSYFDLEQAMLDEINAEDWNKMSELRKFNRKKYVELHNRNLHKMIPIPVFKNEV